MSKAALEDALELPPELTTEKTEQRSVLELWHELFKSVETSASGRIIPQVAMRLLNVWPHLTFEEIPEYVRIYHEYLKEARDILEYEIDQTGVDSGFAFKEGEDDEHNHKHYLNLCLLWQQQAIQWENDWNISDPNAGARIAAIGDAHTFLLGQEGIVAHLATIGYNMTADEKDAMLILLDEFQNGVNGE